jgi:hypothetical protein
MATVLPAHMESPVLFTSRGRASFTGLMRMASVAATLDLSLSGHSTPATTSLKHSCFGGSFEESAGRKCHRDIAICRSGGFVYRDVLYQNAFTRMFCSRMFCTGMFSTACFSIVLGCLVQGCF